MGRIRIRLLASLRDLTDGREIIEVDASTWREALKRIVEMYPRLAEAISVEGAPRPGILMFVDGVDYRLADEGGSEVVILPVNHGGVEVKIVSWSDVTEAVESVSRRIIKSSLDIDMVIGIMRGGVIPARLISDYIGVDELAVIEVKLYKSIGIKSAQPYLKHPLIKDVKDKNVLLVDDISDSGLSLQLALQAISLHSPRNIVTATLYVKPWTRLYPDYYHSVTDKWIIFPWEIYEYRREVEATIK